MIAPGNTVRLAFAFLLLAVIVGVPPVSSQVVDASDEFHHYRNFLKNSDMELDEDLNNVPDEWHIYRWLPEDAPFLREALMNYLDLDIPEIGVSMEGRHAYSGERSVRLFTPSGKIGPGIWTRTSLPPGLYTMNLVARSIRGEDRVVATFLGQEGKLTQVDDSWRWITHSERIPYATPKAVVTINDWTFQEGGVLIDHVSLIKIPFEIQFDKLVRLEKGENTYRVRIGSFPFDEMPIGVNLELQRPSGTITRKNVELEVTPDRHEFVFTIDAEEEGEYSATIELYNPRSSAILFRAEGIRAHYREAEELFTPTRSLERRERMFFPVGISIKGYEMDALEGKGMDAILLKDPSPGDLEDVMNMAREIGLGVIVELLGTDSLHLSERELSVVNLARESPALLGYSLLSGFGRPGEKKASLLNAARELRGLDPESWIFLRNYLPGPLDAEVLDAVDALFIDPFPITEPGKPVYTIANWIDRARRVAGPDVKFVSMIQAFAGWPYAKREPTEHEMRALAALSLNRGVDGVFFHTFSAEFPFFDDAASSNWDMRRSQQVRKAVEEISREVKAFFSRFGKPREVDFPIQFLPEGVVDVAYFSDGQSFYIQVVNVTPVEVSVRAVSPLFNRGDVIGITPAAGAITCGDGFFEDTYEPLAVRLYSLGALLR